MCESYSASWELPFTHKPGMFIKAIKAWAQQRTPAFSFQFIATLQACVEDNCVPFPAYLDTSERLG